MEIENYALIFLNLLPIEKKCNYLCSLHVSYTHTHTFTESYTHMNICKHNHIRKGSEIIQDKLDFTFVKIKTKIVIEFSLISKLLSSTVSIEDTTLERVLELVLQSNTMKPKLQI